MSISAHEAGDWVPRPDPTALTTQQLQRELASLHALLTVRIDAIEKAQITFQDSITRVPSEVDKQISHLKALHEEKFNSVARQFAERDVRSKATEIAASTAVSAALQAQKEAAGAQNESNAAAITKSEVATTKQIDSIQMQIQAITKTTDEKIADVKGRLDRGDGTTSGHIETVAISARNTSMMIAVGGISIAALGLFLTYTTHQSVTNNQPAPPTVVSPAVVPVSPAR